MSGSVRDCLRERVERLNGLLRNHFGCLSFLSSQEVAGQRGVVGKAGTPLLPATLELHEIGLWLQAAETWSLLPNLGKLNRRSYRYAIYGEEPEPQSNPLYRFEYHRFDAGRARTAYGRSGFDHVHVEGAPFGGRTHVPTHRVSLENVLAFLVVEASEKPDPDAAFLVQRARETERELRDWLVIPDTSLLSVVEEPAGPV